MRHDTIIIGAIALLLMSIDAPAHADDWLQHAGGAARTSAAQNAPRDLTALLWTCGADGGGEPIAFEGPSSPVVFNGRIYVNARFYSGAVHSHNKLVCVDAATGHLEYETPIARAASNSWSSPAVDARHGTVLIGSGNTVHAIDAASGGVMWATPLSRNIVNASVVIADDLDFGRALITDFDGAGTGGSLYCLNTSPHDAADNPYEPGEIVWIEPLGGTSGNSPAYVDGVVYVASVTGTASPGYPDVGQVYAFDVSAPEALRRRWSIGVGEGFFSGVTVAGGSVYAASYDAFGGQNNSTLVKIRASDGELIWTVAAERTNSIPVVDGDRIYLAAGIPGFGSVPKVQAFADFGASAVKLWDTFADTGGALLVGGWTHQPVLSGGVLYCGKIPAGNVFFGAYTDLYMLDLSRQPGDSGFIIDHRSGVGSSPAIVDGRIYSIGPTGLSAIATLGDYCSIASLVGGDGVVNGADVQCFVDALLAESPTSAQIALGDYDGDGELTLLDAPHFVDDLIGG